MYIDEHTPLKWYNKQIGTHQHKGYKLFKWVNYKIKDCHFRLQSSIENMQQDLQYNCICVLGQQIFPGDHERCNIENKDFYKIKQLENQEGVYNYDCQSNSILFYYRFEQNQIEDCHYKCVNIFMKDVNKQYPLPTRPNQI